MPRQEVLSPANIPQYTHTQDMQNHFKLETPHINYETTIACNTLRLQIIATTTKLCLVKKGPYIRVKEFICPEKNDFVGFFLLQI